MRLNHVCAVLGAAALMASFVGTAGAQRTPPMAPEQHHTSKMGGIFGHHGMRPMTRMGQIIGNKNTKVYHLPGDKGNMPADKNRVYFKSEREARAAGYHAAGAARGSKSGMTGRHGMMGHPRTGGGTPMPGGRMNGHLPK